jgi:hypothetical protein
MDGDKEMYLYLQHACVQYLYLVCAYVRVCTLRAGVCAVRGRARAHVRVQAWIRFTCCSE